MANKYFAVLNSDSICEALIFTPGTAPIPNSVYIPGDEEPSVIGKRWTGSDWEDVPPAPPVPPVEP